MTATVRLRRGRAKPIWAGHPWVMSGAVDSVEGEPPAGGVVLVTDDTARPIGRGFYAPGSQIRVRMLTLDPEREIDAALLAERIRRAAQLRTSLGLPGPGTDAYRVVHGSGDGLPGVVADRYGDHVALQLTVRGMEDRREVIAAALAETLGVRGVVLRRVPAFEEAEGLAGAEGDLLPDRVPEEVRVTENGIAYHVDLRRGQKTGHYTDHRENRALLGSLAAGRVLDAFCGTGGFALAALAGAARSAVAADSSAGALDLARRNAEANGVLDRLDLVREDVFRLLRRLEQERERFDTVVLDPPRLAVRKRDLPGALRGLRELGLRALRLLGEGGLLATATCTGLISERDHERTLREAALETGREVQVLHVRGAGPDHPWSIAAPESRYLKFLIARVRRR